MFSWNRLSGTPVNLFSRRGNTLQSLIGGGTPAASPHSDGRHERIRAQHLAAPRQVPNRDTVAEWSRLWSLSLACNQRPRKTNCPDGLVFPAAPPATRRQLGL